MSAGPWRGAEETAHCNTDECVVNCLGDWSEFSECTQQCGGWVLKISSPKLSRFVRELAVIPQTPCSRAGMVMVDRQ